MWCSRWTQSLACRASDGRSGRSVTRGAPPPPRLLVVPGDARCAARLGRYKRAECSCTVGDGCRKEIEQRRSRSRSRWRWIGDGDRAADGSTSRACLERVGWGARLLAVQPAEGRSETNSTTTVYTPQGCQTRATSQTPPRGCTSMLFSLHSTAMTSDVAFSGSVRARARAPCQTPRGRATQPTLVTARTRAKVGNRPGSYGERQKRGVWGTQ
jgi:hypothetical protein